jgi:hypothetical protein
MWLFLIRSRRKLVNSLQPYFSRVSYTAWTQKDDKTSAGSSGTSDADEQKQRAAFRQWYINNGGSPNSANSYASAIGKTKLKNGRAVFAVAVYDELNAAIENGGLDGYFQTSGGDYTKMEAVFDIESSVQRDDLKSGIKHYLVSSKARVHQSCLLEQYY